MMTGVRSRAAIAFLLGTLAARAEVRLPAVIADNMVLQAPKAVVWGAAAPHETVSVRIGKRSGRAVAGADGKWSVTLERLKTGGAFEMTISGSNTITLHNVAVGDVWLCAGASNMAMPVNGAADADKEIAAARYPEIRFFKVERGVAPAPAAECAGKWVVCNPSSVVDFSAAAYFFGRNLNQRTKSPTGLIESAYSATPIEAWISTPALQSRFQPLLDAWKADAAAYPRAKETYDQLHASWQQQSQRAKDAGQMPPAPPIRPRAPDDPAAPSGVYNAMIAPLAPFAIKGVLWYQGEANVHDPKDYGALFATLIESWRSAWGKGPFPFVFEQLAGFLPKTEEPSDSLWAELREAQASALKLPQTAMAVAIDIGDEHSLLPKNKQEAGRRLALAAEEVAYGMDDTGQAPRFSGMKITGGKARVAFSGTGGGLTAKGGEPLKGFVIAGADKRFVAAQAKIEKNKVVVWSDKVPKPTAVRYAWADTPDGNLFSGEGLPAAPFRTDAWAAISTAPDVSNP